ncbi:MAG: glycogen synthase 2 [Thermodesulfobacteriota bacterium]|nr:MAG: glycogen synthase 2 [Thermodesulfobacteriota bacterium]
MNVLFVASEMEPFAKTGGLADVIGVLPKRLSDLGLDVRVVMPLYKEAERNLRRLGFKVQTIRNKEVMVPIDWISYKGKIKETKIDGITIYFLINEEFYDRDFIYGSPSGDFSDNDVRFGFLSLGALEIAKAMDFQPDIIHCNDWQTALVPISLKWKKHYNDEPFFKNTKVVYTIHNIAYQGLYQKELINKFGLPSYIFNMDGLEFYGKANLMKGGIISSDLVTTVSPRYAEEIKTPDYGYWLDGVLRSISNQGKLAGIMNGLDYDVWDPEKDNAICMKYSAENLDGKIMNKMKLRKHLGFKSKENKPLIGIVSRLADQKGIDLIVNFLDQILKLDVELVVLGTGDKNYENILTEDMNQYGDSFSAIIGYNDKKARAIYAGCDMFLMPSRFEPCGLGQLMALKYGTIPIVRGTGGLLDSIIDYNRNPERGNGFVFHEFNGEEMLKAIENAISVYNNPIDWTQLVRKAMAENFSWRKASEIYHNHYNRLLGH